MQKITFQSKSWLNEKLWEMQDYQYIVLAYDTKLFFKNESQSNWKDYYEILHHLTSSPISHFKKVQLIDVLTTQYI